MPNHRSGNSREWNVGHAGRDPPQVKPATSPYTENPIVEDVNQEEDKVEDAQAGTHVLMGRWNPRIVNIDLPDTGEGACQGVHILPEEEETPTYLSGVEYNIGPNPPTNSISTPRPIRRVSLTLI